jgi:hypothetical protein
MTLSKAAGLEIVATLLETEVRLTAHQTTTSANIQRSIQFFLCTHCLSLLGGSHYEPQLQTHGHGQFAKAMN